MDGPPDGVLTVSPSHGLYIGTINRAVSEPDVDVMVGFEVIGEVTGFKVMGFGAS